LQLGTKPLVPPEEGRESFPGSTWDVTPEVKANAKIVRKYDRFPNHLKIILLNLLYFHGIDPDMVISYSADKNIHSNPKNDGSFILKYHSMAKIIAALSRLEYVEKFVGYYDKSKGAGKRSRMRATAKLIDLVRLHSGNILIRNRILSSEGAIILRDINKKSIGYKVDKDIIRMRKNLKLINERISKAFVGLCVPDDYLAKIMVKLRSKRSKGRMKFRKTLDFGKKALIRVFNNGSFSDGGRFYGPCWQAIPSADRKYIRIDDEPTCELDFSGMHVKIMYANEGLSVPEDDVYKLDGISTDARKILKKIFNILINAKTEDKALRSIRRNFRRKDHPVLFSSDAITHGSIITAFKEKHKSIAKYICSGHGVKLQAMDAQIAEEILLHLGDKGIVALPVHDSLIVKTVHRQELLDAMKIVTMSKYNQDFAIKDNDTAYKTDMETIRKEFPDEDIPKSEKEYADLARKGCTTYNNLMEVWNTKHSDFHFVTIPTAGLLTV